MKESTEAIISDFSGTIKDEFTKVTFQPDLKLLNMERFDKDIAQLLKKRAFDMAGIFRGRIKVFLNEKQI